MSFLTKAFSFSSPSEEAVELGAHRWPPLRIGAEARRQQLVGDVEAVLGAELPQKACHLRRPPILLEALRRWLCLHMPASFVIVCAIVC